MLEGEVAAVDHSCSCWDWEVPESCNGRCWAVEDFVLGAKVITGLRNAS